jgi:hypothetical protein
MTTNEENNCIVYRHIRLDKNEVFYIGIAKQKNRPYESGKRRSVFWNKIVKKSEYEVEIIFDNLSWEKAKEKEKEFIKLYGRKNLNNGTLVNMTDGGDGSLNPCLSTRLKIAENSRKKVWTKESREKLSKSKSGVNHHMYGIKGDKNPAYGKKHSQESKEKMSKARLGFVTDREVVNRIADKLRGRKRDPHIGIAVAEFHSKIVLDTQNGIYYKNAKEAAEFLNIKYSTLKCWLNGSRKNTSNLIYV